MAKISIVLVEPKHQCNIGFVARAMKNFGVQKLFFSGKKVSLDSKAFECAANAEDVLKNATNLEGKRVETIFDLVIGSTAKPHSKESSPRMAITPEQLSNKLREIDGDVALLFGREDRGLTNRELDVCDLVVSIPADPGYGTLNISHAVAVVLYEMNRSVDQIGSDEIRQVSGEEKEALLRRLATLIDSIEYPNFKKRVALRIFKNVIGRAGISAREAHTIAGIFKEADDEIKRRRKG